MTKSSQIAKKHQKKRKKKNTNTHRHAFKQCYIHEIQSDIYIHIYTIQHVFQECSYPTFDEKVHL